MTSLELVPFVQWKPRNPFAPIHGLLILQGPMTIWGWIAIQLKLGWESLSPMKHKDLPSSNQKGWQSSWPMGLEDPSSPLSWISWWGLLSLILIFSVRWPSHPTFSS
jgi:hypothetical protein